MEKKTECLVIDFLKGFCNDCLARERDEYPIIKTLEYLLCLIEALFSHQRFDGVRKILLRQVGGKEDGGGEKSGIKKERRG